MTSRKKPGVAFWATVVVVVVLVAYPLGMGPYLAMPNKLAPWMPPVYRPMGELILNGPDWLIEPYLCYLNVWTKLPICDRLREMRAARAKP